MKTTIFHPELQNRTPWECVFGHFYLTTSYDETEWDGYGWKNGKKPETHKFRYLEDALHFVGNKTKWQILHYRDYDNFTSGGHKLIMLITND